MNHTAGLRPVVPDASVLVELLWGSDKADRVRSQVEEPDLDLHVPMIADLEVISGLSSLVRRGGMPRSRLEQAAVDYLDLDLTRHPHVGLLGRVVELDANFSAYAAAYVALAEVLEAELITGDKRLAHAVSRYTQVPVVLVA